MELINPSDTIYECRRTSRLHQKPCDEAFPISVKSSGKPQLWGVKFESLKNLEDFLDKYGNCIVNVGSIEIYDDYRE